MRRREGKKELHGLFIHRRLGKKWVWAVEGDFVCVYELGINKCVTLEDYSTENPNFKIMQICKILGDWGKFLNVTPTTTAAVASVSYLTWDSAPRPPASRILPMSSHPSSVALFSSPGLKATSKPSPSNHSRKQPKQPPLFKAVVSGVFALSMGGRQCLFIKNGLVIDFPASCSLWPEQSFHTAHCLPQTWMPQSVLVSKLQLLNWIKKLIFPNLPFRSAR